ncbi:MULTISPECIES: hypothetical protein [unclassified Rathayibacter]|uniref:hypothetical protein n=1 Tax=unclassified Rathayibacter TaxID=2609250 RepID=UPI0011B0D9B8|nr:MULTISPECIES: hypothetical protein [unclassified Rathayibacter]
MESTTRLRWVTGAAVMALTTTLMAGCSGPDTEAYSDFKRAQDERDALPDVGTVGDGYDPASIRYVGSAYGLEVWIGSQITTGGRCVIVDGEGDNEDGSGCGDELSLNGAWVVQIHTDGAGPDDADGLDWTSLGENVSIRRY